MNWRAKPLISLETIINLIGATKTSSGLEVYARLDQGAYPESIKVRDAELKAVNLHGDTFHPERNYSIKPKCSLSTRPKHQRGNAGAPLRQAPLRNLLQAKPGEPSGLIMGSRRKSRSGRSIRRPHKQRRIEFDVVANPDCLCDRRYAVSVECSPAQ